MPLNSLNQLHPKAKTIQFKIDNYDSTVNNSFNLTKPEIIFNNTINFDFKTCEDLKQFEKVYKRRRRRRHPHEDKNKFLMEPISLVDKFSFRFKRLINKNQFIEFDRIFQYKTNPNETNVDINSVGLHSENSELIFYGKNFQSILYPELELIFKSNQSEKRLLTECDYVHPTRNHSAYLSCFVPPMNSLNVYHSNKPMQAQYTLHLDENIKPNGLITFYPDPKFFPFNMTIVSESNRSLLLLGENLSSDFPVKIEIGNHFQCLTKNRAHTFIDCEININKEELKELIDVPMKVKVTIGTNITQYVVDFSFLIK
ncbi:hypothetical protein BLA29_007804 [Euroglyphus maynei]|uniref:IPT/TIG domain-containing protein n=1 Tax=Euroglyphus maynei TaxID=6958 RepID=A0A1Y3BLJ1_EURMA|nr:hypothetical protein BLA29_007804 [Euroglyphus maynei]